MAGTDMLPEEAAGLAAAARRSETPCGAGGMAWRQWGAGRPLVLLHGGYGSWLHWLRNIPALAERRRVIAADLPGLGESADAPTPYTAETLAAIVADGLCRVLGDGESFDLVGFSFGGLLGGHVAAALGERCERLVLVGPGGLGLPRAPIAALQGWREAAASARAAIHRRNLEILMFADPAKIDDVAVRVQALNAERGRTKSPPLARTDTLARVLPGVTARLAAIWGGGDVTAMDDFPARAGLLRGIRPGVPVLLVTGAGHWVQYEAAGAFNEALAGLLDEAPP
jgi:pimeloyl-ACP methyl ester carboxylesterase